MDTNRFALTSVWHIPTDADAVWAALRNVELWPTWWPYVKRVRVIDCGDSRGLGARQRFTWTSALPYELSFVMQVTDVVPGRALAGRADGDLVGRGLWTLAAERAGTRVQYEWIVEAHRPWMRRLAPLLAPMYRWNHGRVMAAGERGLIAHLAP